MIVGCIDKNEVDENNDTEQRRSEERGCYTSSEKMSVDKSSMS